MYIGRKRIDEGTKMKLKLPKLVWDGGGDREIDFPDSWDVNFCPTRGWDRPAMTDDQMREAIASPVGTAHRDRAQGRKKSSSPRRYAPDPVYRIAPLVLDELREAGIADESVCHRLRHRRPRQSALEPAKHTGRFFVFQHNHEHCVCRRDGLCTPLSPTARASCDL
jgi:hypothetical protein